MTSGAGGATAGVPRGRTGAVRRCAAISARMLVSCALSNASWGEFEASVAATVCLSATTSGCPGGQRLLLLRQLLLQLEKALLLGVLCLLDLTANGFARSAGSASTGSTTPFGSCGMTTLTFLLFDDEVGIVLLYKVRAKRRDPAPTVER